MTVLVYSIYGLSVESNLELSYVDAGRPGVCDMRLHVSFAEMPPVQPIRILESEQWLTIELFPFAVYRLDRYSNDVFCQAADYESFTRHFSICRARSFFCSAVICFCTRHHWFTVKQVN